MLTILLISIIALFLTILDSLKLLEKGLLYAFILTTVIAAIRYDYGNDYMPYYDDYLRYNNYYIQDIINGYVEFKEPGWSIFCILFSIFGQYGFFAMVAVISILCNWIYYRFIIENVQRRYYWLALFIYLFTFDMYVLQMSMIRQGIAISLFVYSYHFIKRRKLLIPILLCVLAYTFHRSSIIYFPFILLSLFKWDIYGKSFSWILLGAFVIFFIGNSITERLFGNLLTLEEMSIYERYTLAEGNKIGVRRILEFIPFFVSLYYLAQKNTDKKGQKYMVMLSTIATILYPFTMIAHMALRLTYYFSIYYIATIPITYFNIKDKVLRYGLLSIFMLITLYLYYTTYKSPVYVDAFSKYQTIFSVL